MIDVGRRLLEKIKVIDENSISKDLNTNEKQKKHCKQVFTSP
jgi:hypothetical protein